MKEAETLCWTVLGTRLDQLRSICHCDQVPHDPGGVMPVSVKFARNQKSFTAKGITGGGSGVGWV